MELSEVLDEIKATQESFKTACIEDAMNQSLDWYRGGYNALENLATNLKLRSETLEKREVAESTEKAIRKNIDTLREGVTWIPGQPLIREE